MIKFLFSKASLHAKCEVIKYVISLHRKSDDEIIAAVKHQRGLRAWCSQRSYYLAALRYECARRGVAYIQ